MNQATDLNQFAYALGDSQHQQLDKLDLIIDLVGKGVSASKVPTAVDPTVGTYQQFSTPDNQTVTATLNTHTSGLSSLNGVGFHAETGQTLTGMDLIKQEIRNLIVTPVGSCVADRDYGTHLLEYIDRPFSNVTILELYAEIIEAVDRWFYNIVRLDRVWANRNTHQQTGRLALSLKGEAL